MTSNAVESPPACPIAMTHARPATSPCTRMAWLASYALIRAMLAGRTAHVSPRTLAMHRRLLYLGRRETRGSDQQAERR